jgi:thymidylate synthase
MEFKFNNVNDAFRGLVRFFLEVHPTICKSFTRNGTVLYINEPVLISYSAPCERVLLHPGRDCNPALHLYEALWMLAGRNDVAPLSYYAKQMAEYSDDGKTLNGAYGYRWRKAEPWEDNTLDGEYCGGFKMVDQLDILVAHLKADPTSRRAVLQMWMVEDLLQVSKSRDVPCNTAVYFSLQGGCESCKFTGTYRGRYTPDDTTSPYVEEPCENCQGMFLNMTVTNRSNDLVWGLCGANFVHFSFLQEYMAARLGCEVGRFTTMSNNLHIYTERHGVKLEEWLEWYEESDEAPLFEYDGVVWDRDKRDPVLVPLVKDPKVFEDELPKFVEYHARGNDEPQITTGNGQWIEWKEPFLDTVTHPLLNAFHAHKRKDRDAAMSWAGLIKSDDWRVAMTNWLTRRYTKETV